MVSSWKDNPRKFVDSFLFRKLGIGLSMKLAKEMVNTKDGLLDETTPEGLFIALIFYNIRVNHTCCSKIL
jgi:hypothetical protein